MSSANVKTGNDKALGGEPVDMKLEVVMIGVSDVERATRRSRYEMRTRNY